MKRIFFLLLIISIASCESDDDGGSNTDFSYFPLSVNNSWEYEVSTGSDSSTDMLEVTSVSGNEYTLTSAPAQPAGFMTRILSGGALKQEAGKLIGNGSIDFGLQGLNNFDVTITDGTLYDQNARANEELFSTTGTTNQTVQGFDLDITYTVRTVQQRDLDQLVVDGITYTEVIHSQLIVNATVSTDVLNQQVNFLEPQDVIVIDNYWSRDIGLIQSNNQLDYTLQDFSSFGVTLPIPQSASILTVQNLQTFNVQ